MLLQKLVLRAIFEKHLYQLLHASFGAPDKVTVPAYIVGHTLKGTGLNRGYVYGAKIPTH